MKKIILQNFTLLTILVLNLLPLLPLGAQTGQQSDEGYLFLGPRKEIQTKKIQKDRMIQAFTRDGVIITETVQVRGTTPPVLPTEPSSSTVRGIF